MVGLCMYNILVYEWNEAKRLTNLQKHGLDFADAGLVYENPNKVTYPSHRTDELRMQDTAVVGIEGRFLTLVYVPRENNIRLISFRRASLKERRRYATAEG